MSRIPLTIQSQSADETAVIIDGRRVEQFWGEKVMLAIDTVGNGFSFSAPFYPDTKQYRDIFRPFSYHECRVYIGGKLQINGRIEKVTPAVASDSVSVTVQGRSRTAAIVDCCFTSAETKEFAGADLQEIATAVCAPFGFSVEFPDGAGAKFSRAGVRSPATRKFEFLQRLARQRGLLMSQTPEGNLLFRKPNVTGKPVAELHEGSQGLMMSGASFDGSKRFSDYEVYGQEPGRNDNYAAVNDPSIKVFRPRGINANDTNQGNIETAARWALSSDIANSISISVGYEGWLRPDGELWQENELILLYAPSIMIYKPMPMLIKSVSFSSRKDSKTTELGLCLPAAYTGEIPEVFPWDE